MLQELALFDAELTTRRLLEVISTDSPVVSHKEHYNLDLEVSHTVILYLGRYFY